MIRSAAGTDCTAGRAEVAAILADHGVVAAFTAQLALGRQHLVAGGVWGLPGLFRGHPKLKIVPFVQFLSK